MTLTPRRQDFVAAYVADPNATQAAINAGYSVATVSGPGTEGHRLLQNAEVQQAIETRRSQIALSASLDAEYVLSGLMRAAEYAERAGNTPAATAALRELGRYLQLFTDRIEVTEVRRKAAEMTAQAGLAPEDAAEVARIAQQLLEEPK